MQDCQCVQHLLKDQPLPEGTLLLIICLFCTISSLAQKYLFQVTTANIVTVEALPSASVEWSVRSQVRHAELATQWFITTCTICTYRNFRAGGGGWIFCMFAVDPVPQRNILCVTLT